MRVFTDIFKRIGSKESHDGLSESLPVMESLFFSIMTIDARKRTYTINHGKENLDGKLDSSGNYTSLCAFITDSLSRETDREQFPKLISLDNLEKSFEQGVSHIQFILNTEINGGSSFALFIFCMKGKDGNADKYIFAFSDRTAEQNEEMLYREFVEESLSAAEKATKAKNIFLSNMSHDLRTPLNAVTGMAELAFQSMDNQTYLKNYLKKLKSASDQLVEIVESILDLSKIEAGSFTIREQRINLVEFILDITREIEDRRRKKSIDFSFNIEDVGFEFFRSDRDHLHQVLSIILDNAIKYTQTGGKVSMKIRELEAIGESRFNMEFEISDTGMGMEDEIAGHIFDPFFRSDDKRTTKIAGTGAGLSIANAIVTMMNGSIVFNSKKGAGTTFTVRIPAGTDVSENNANTSENEFQTIGEEFKIASVGPDEIGDAPKEEVPEQPVTDFRNDTAGKDGIFSGKKILIVEDNELNSEIASGILRNMGIQTDVAEDGVIGVKKLEDSATGTYDLVLMDIKMPNMNGYEATSTIRKSSRPDIRKIPVVALTADTYPDDIQRAFDCGMNAHLSKPLNVQRLIKTLGKFL